MTTTWSPTQKNFFITLSNGNLTALGIQTGGLNACGLAVPGAVMSAGAKKYWEYAIQAVDVPDGSQPGVGVGNISTNLADSVYLGIDPNSLANYSGAVFLNNIQIASIPGYTLGDTVGVAVDRTLNLIWFRNQGGFAWNAGGTANPATGVGGIDISSLGDIYPAYNVKMTEQITTNFGATAFAFTVPAGFTGFDSPPVTNPDQGTGAGSHRIGRRPKSRKVKGVLEKIEAEQVAEVLPEPVWEVAQPVEPRTVNAVVAGSSPALSAKVAPRLDGISEKLTRIEGTLRLNAAKAKESARIAKENARVEAARVAKAAEDEEDEFMLLVA